MSLKEESLLLTLIASHEARLYLAKKEVEKLEFEIKGLKEILMATVKRNEEELYPKIEE